MLTKRLFFHTFFVCFVCLISVLWFWFLGGVLSLIFWSCFVLFFLLKTWWLKNQKFLSWFSNYGIESSARKLCPSNPRWFCLEVSFMALFMTWIETAQLSAWMLFLDHGTWFLILLTETLTHKFNRKTSTKTWNQSD